MKAPSLVELATDSHMMVLHWPDAPQQRIAYRTLREACACATCRRLRIDGNVFDSTEDVVVLEIRPMGYGIQVIFSDGHDRGIFPWSYLAEGFESHERA